MQLAQHQTAFNPQAKRTPNRHPQSEVLICGEVPVSIAVVNEQDPTRMELETFIQQSFARVYQAKITYFMPTLLSLKDQQQNLRAVCGLRHAEEAPLFLENYFAEPIETILSEKTGSIVRRDEIIEIGNLAILEPACIRSLLASVSVYLHQTEVKWVVFTGIQTLINALNKLHLPLHLLGQAHIDCLPAEEHASWGRYYDLQPKVIAISRMQQGY